MAGAAGGSAGGSSGGASGGASGAAYGQAIMGVINVLSNTAGKAAYEAAYGKFYQAAAGRLNAADARVAAEANIAAIVQDKINTNTIINIHQSQAEAQAKLAAAVGGVDGQSVNQVIHQTEVNSSLAKANNRRQVEQQLEQQLANVYQATSTASSLSEPLVTKPSIGLGFLEDVSGLIKTDGKNLVEGFDRLFGEEQTQGDITINYQLPSENSPQLA